MYSSSHHKLTQDRQFQTEPKPNTNEPQPDLLASACSHMQTAANHYQPMRWRMKELLIHLATWFNLVWAYKKPSIEKRTTHTSKSLHVQAYVFLCGNRYVVTSLQLHLANVLYTVRGHSTTPHNFTTSQTASWAQVDSLVDGRIIIKDRCRSSQGRHGETF